MLPCTLNQSRISTCSQTAGLQPQELAVLSHKHPLYHKIQNQLNSSAIYYDLFSSSKRKVNTKMLNKLINWMRLLSKQTLEFSTQTYQLAVKILFRYLQKVDDGPETLQLIGSVALHLASKISEKQIISIDSYEKCSKNIFTKEMFEAKQRQIFSTLNYNVNFITMQRIIHFLKLALALTPTETNILHEQSSLLVNDCSFWLYPDYHILIHILGLFRLQSSIPSRQELLNSLAKYNI